MTQTSYTVSGLTLGTTYLFTVEARNTNGYSTESSEVTILHAMAPETPSTPTSSNSGTNVLIDWNAPSDNGSTISSYTITIRQSDGTTYTEDSTNCNGSDSSVISSTSCTVPLSVLTSSPYLLGVGDSIFVKVVATNIKGSSSESSIGSGALVITNPDVPVSLAEDTAERTVSTLGLTWSAGTSNGGSAILDYRIN